MTRRERRRKLTPRQERLHQHYELAHTRTLVIACGLAEQLKRMYGPEDFEDIATILNGDLAEACAIERRAWEEFDKARGQKVHTVAARKKKGPK
jgi:hypothetical protein